MKDYTDLVRASKYLSLVLRHKPDLLQLKMDAEGWVNVDELIKNFNRYNSWRMKRDDLDKIVAENNKKRFAYSDDGKRIRASQGHSIDIDLNLPESIPLSILYHGTSTRFIDLIMKDGLNKMSRQHVHLSDNIRTAQSVGSRHGEPVILIVRAWMMHNDGFKFFKSENGVWLTDNVPRQYIEISHRKDWIN
jgi:putative RNA 2'-phosphotransferase